MPQDLIGNRKRRKLKALIPRVVVFVNDPPSAERKREGSILLSFLLFYGLMVGKYALICAMPWKLRKFIFLIPEKIKATEK